MAAVPAVALLALSSQTAQQVDFASLLAQLTDPRASCEVGERAFVAHAVSSRGAAPGPDPGTGASAGSGEVVLADLAGPGAVVRMAASNPRGRLAVRVDGAAEPVLEGPMEALLGGALSIPAPLAGARGGWFAAHLPVPFAARCRITCSDCDGVDFDVAWRLYGDATRVEGLRAADLVRARGALEAACEALRRPAIDPRSERRPFEILLSGTGGDSAVRSCSIDVAAGPTGALCVTEIALELDSEPAERRDRIQRALQSTWIALEFDGHETVRAPLGDFFGAPAGLDPFATVDLELRRAGRMLARFPMPFRERATLRLESLSGERVLVRGSIATAPYTWTERSLYFHAAWARAEALAVDPPRDWRALAVEGRGVLVGESLCILNQAPGWWGARAAHIAVDAAPPLASADAGAHFLFAPRVAARFDSPFGARARCDGPLDLGWSVQTRVRALDAVPFDRSLSLDFGFAHETSAAEISCSATTYFYAAAGARVERTDLERSAERVRSAGSASVVRVPGALEAEELELLHVSDGVSAAPDAREGTSAGRVLAVRAPPGGGSIELALPIAEPGPREILVLASGPARARLSFSVNGAAAQGDVELPAPQPHSLGTFDVATPRAVLRVDVTAAGPAPTFALDCFLTRPPRR